MGFGLFKKKKKETDVKDTNEIKKASMNDSFNPSSSQNGFNFNNDMNGNNMNSNFGQAGAGGGFNTGQQSGNGMNSLGDSNMQAGSQGFGMNQQQGSQGGFNLNSNASNSNNNAGGMGGSFGADSGSDFVNPFAQSGNESNPFLQQNSAGGTDPHFMMGQQSNQSQQQQQQQSQNSFGSNHLELPNLPNNLQGSNNSEGNMQMGQRASGSSQNGGQDSYYHGADVPSSSPAIGGGNVHQFENASNSSSGQSQQMQFQNQQDDFNNMAQEVKTISLGGSGQGGGFNEERIQEMIDETVEKLIEEKWNSLMENVDKVLKWKDKKDAEINMIKEDLVSLGDGFNKLEMKLINKITSYDKNILDVNSEIKALEKVFQKITPTLINNVNELSKIADEFKGSDKNRKKRSSYDED